MMGFNHGLTGGIIAGLLPLPAALPLAFASHFVLDALPHYGILNHKRDTSNFWKVFFVADTLATAGLAIYAITDHHYSMFLGGLAAVIPDFVWVGIVIRTRSFNLSEYGNWFTRWHAGIQKYERPWGIWIEIPLALLLCFVVFGKLW